MKFAGYTKVYEVAETDDAEAPRPPRARIACCRRSRSATRSRSSRVRPEQHFTQPPPRFSEASLVKELEEKGIGRPSTYAAIMSTIVDRGYVEKKEARFWPTELGILVNGLLVVSFPEIVSTRLHREDGERSRQGRGRLAGLARRCSAASTRRSRIELEKARAEMRDVKREEIATEWVCEKCGKPMVIKWGRNGSFLACQGYPECRNTMEVVEEPRRHVGEGPAADHRRDLRDLRARR